MGIFDIDNKWFFNGIFDFNSDGKTDLGEQYIAYKIFEETTKKSEKNSYTGCCSGTIFETDSSDNYDWRLYCENGFEFGLDPEDYETEEEYEEALEIERTAWRDTCEDGADSGLDPEDYETEEEYEEAPAEAQESESNAEITLNISVECPEVDEIREEDYPNKRRYNAAYTLANEFLIYSNDEYEKKEKACCSFIIDKADTILAANYLSHDRGFLYAQAIKDNFDVPCCLPDEDEAREIEFSQLLCKIAKRDVSLSFEIWSWCLEKFLPYSEYDDFCVNDLSIEVIDDIPDYPDGYMSKLVHYMSDNEHFFELVMSGDESASRLSQLIAEAIKEKLFKTADLLFKNGLKMADEKWKNINELTEEVILWCKNYEELESIEYFRDNLLPMVKAIPLGMVQDETAEWEKDISDYIDCVEDECEQYAFTRKNAWRKKVPNGKEYGLDPLYYDTEQEYLEALRDEAKEARHQEPEERLQQSVKAVTVQEQTDDKSIYTYCGVLLSFSPRPYFFRTDNDSIKIGDMVIVPVGEHEKEMKGEVVSVGQYSRLGVPYPIEKTKSIIRKADD